MNRQVEGQIKKSIDTQAYVPIIRCNYTYMDKKQRDSEVAR